MRIAVMLAALIAFTVPAHAQQAACGPRDAVLTHLAEKYGEHPVSAGITANGVIELVVEPTGATWTILVTLPSGMSCLVASGEGWQLAKPPGRQS